MSSKVKIKNLRHTIFKVEVPWHIKVDRSSPLGNPFPMDMATGESRDIVCDKYGVWFVKQLTTDRDDPTYNKLFNTELGRLERIYEKYRKLELFCWCAPKRCHAQTIKRYLEGVL